MERSSIQHRIGLVSSEWSEVSGQFAVSGTPGNKQKPQTVGHRGVKTLPPARRTIGAK